MAKKWYRTNHRGPARVGLFPRLPLVPLLLLACLMLLGATRCPALDLTIWDFPRWLEPGETVDRFTWMRRQLRQFEAENPGITVRLSELTWNRGHEKLKIAALGGQFPDVAPGTVPLLFIQEGLVEPVDAYLEPGDREDFLPGALQAFTIGSQTYGWPWYMSGQLLYVNRAFFASAGVDLPREGRWTTEEFEAKLTALRDHLKAEPEKKPLGLYFQKDQTACFPFAFAFGGDWVGPDRTFRGDSPETLRGLAWLRGLIERGIAPADAGGRTADDVWMAFGREHRLAVAALGLWAIKVLSEKYPMDFEVVHYPAPAGRANGPFLGISGFYVFRRPGEPERVRAAMKLARFLTLGARQRDLAGYAQFPTRRSAGNIYPGNPHMTRAWEVMQDGRTVLSDPRWSQIDEEIAGAVQGVLLGRTGATEAMRLAGGRVGAMLERHQGSVRDDLQKGSWLGTLFLWACPAVLIFALLSRQVHLLMVVPALSVLMLFLVYPLGDALVLAFRDYRIGEVGGFTLGNFARAFEDPKFVKACWHTLAYTVLVVPANVLSALVAASLIYGLPGRAKGLFRALYYLPGVASVVVLSMVWRWLFNTEVGLFNTVLRGLGLPAVGWLTNPDWAMGSIILTGILRSPGGAILIYLASLANIPPSLLESADLEGATPFQKWWYITVPLLRSTTLFLLITGTIDALQVFAQVLMLTDGGPGDATAVVVHRVYTAAFRDFDFGLSSAMALLLFVAIMIVTLVQRRWTEQDMEGMA
ncbi:MAG: extracellular solute-binding protein [Candidatus Riflebacteria bacterium]|nr:extracellular solute-binding protein [Candidatus Riflebacteria bacterium]